MTALEATIEQILELDESMSVGIWFARGKVDGFVAMAVGEECELPWKANGCLEHRADTIEAALLGLFDDFVALKEKAANPEPPKKKRGRPRKEPQA